MDLGAAERELVDWLAAQLDRSSADVLESVLTPPEAPGLVATTVVAGRFTRLSLRAIGQRLRWENPIASDLTVPLTGLDALTELDVSEMELDALDLSSQPTLVRLEASGNRLKQLELDGNPALETLNVAANDLMVLDLRENPRTWFCDCTGNALTALVLAEPNVLKVLRCARNQLMVLDPGPTPELTELDCGRNALVRLVLDAPRLRTLRCQRNQLTELDVGALPELTRLKVSRNRLASLPLQTCARLEELDCARNYLDHLALVELVRLERVDVSFNQLESLSLGRCAALVHLDCGNNHLRTLAIADCPSLEVLVCEGNGLDALPLADAPSLCDLRADHNRFHTLSLGQNPRLARVQLRENPLERLELDQNHVLAYLELDDGVVVVATPTLRQRLKALRRADGRPTGGALARMDRWQAHAMAATYDEPDRERVFLPLVRDTARCARGTAVMLYWMASPHYYLQFDDRSEVPAYAQAGWDLITAVEEHVRNGDYAHDDLFFDPRDDQQTTEVRGRDWTRDESGASRVSKRTIPAFMTRACGV
ncbi:MAG: DUF4274 domain-containing protein [Myxococcota bacterium]